MKKFILICCLVLLVPASLWATCTTPCTLSGTVWTCTDISRDCVQGAAWASDAAPNVANEIRVVSGTATWSDVSACTFQDSGDTVTNVNHGLVDNQVVKFRTIVTTTGISVDTTYYVRNSTANTFQVSTSSGGAALPLTTDGTGTYYTKCSNVTDAPAAICLHRGVKMVGSYGGGTTTITIAGNNARGAITYNPYSAARSANEPFEFSGFVVDSNEVNYGESVLNISATNDVHMNKIKIHDNTFKNGAAGAGHGVTINGVVSAVVYSNIFEDIDTAVKVESGGTYAWGNITQAYADGWGVYVEDNIMRSVTAGKLPGSFTAGQGAIGAVWRYNSIDYNNVQCSSGQCQEIHGLQSMACADGFTCPSGCGYENATPTQVNSCNITAVVCDQWAPLKNEMYGNIYTNYYWSGGGNTEMMRHRGSWLMMFNNLYTGTGNAPIPSYFQYSCDSCQNPASPAYSQHVQNTYVFNNTYNGDNEVYIKNTYPNSDFCAASGGYAIAENTDFFNYNAACTSSSCATGVGCGATAPTGTCATGTAYWVTSASPCTTPPATMAGMKTSIQAGTLYKCTAPNTWTAYYTPYTYPHPLRGGAGVDYFTFSGGARMSGGGRMQ